MHFPNPFLWQPGKRSGHDILGAAVSSLLAQLIVWTIAMELSTMHIYWGYLSCSSFTKACRQFKSQWCHCSSFLASQSSWPVLPREKRNGAEPLISWCPWLSANSPTSNSSAWGILKIWAGNYLLSLFLSYWPNFMTTWKRIWDYKDILYCSIYILFIGF